MGTAKNPYENNGKFGCIVIILMIIILIVGFNITTDKPDVGELHRSVDTVETVINTRGRYSVKDQIKEKAKYTPSYNDSIGYINILSSEFKSAHYSSWNGDNTYFHVIYEVERFNYKN